MREFNQVAIVDNVSQANAITHLEPTQIDVIFATAILSLHMDLRIFCTNDSKLIEEVKNGDKNKLVIFDVGGEYDPDRLLFDRHQHGFEEHYYDFMKYATAGIIWKRFSMEILLKYDCPVSQIATVAEEVSRDLIHDIDVRGNGYIPACTEMSVSDAVELFSKNWDEGSTCENVSFIESVQFARLILDGKIRKSISVARAHSKMAKWIATSSGGVFVMDTLIADWEKYVLKSPNTKAKQLIYGVYPTNGEWRVQSIPPALNRPRDARKTLPVGWCGMSGERLVKKTGVKTATFCHPNCLIAGALTFDDALKLAHLALLH
mgnify:FL=1